MKLSIGTAQFGFNYGISNKTGTVNFEEVKKIINFCRKKKIYFIDTAKGYGKAQKVLGILNLNKFQIISKISNIRKYNNTDLENYITLEVNNILKELNIKKLYALLIHNISELKNEAGVDMYKILNKLKKKKKFVKLGVSIYNTKELEFVLNNFNIDIINLPISVANQQFCEKKYLSILKKKKIEIHVRSIFLQGLLLSNYRSLPKKFKENKFFIQWFNWLKVNKYNSLDVCIGFIKNIKYIDKIIIGVDNLNQLKMIVKSYKKNLNYNLIKFNQSSILRKPSLW